MTVKSGAFQHLNKLEIISFQSTSISAIENQAFKLNLTSSRDEIIIVFDWCNITGDVFQNGSFDGINGKPLHIGFSSTHINYLDEKIFKTVLKNKDSYIYLSLAYLDCSDCGNYWLAKDYNHDKVHSPNCYGEPKKDLFDEEIKTKLNKKCKKL